MSTTVPTSVENNPALTINTLGMRCPEPLMLIRKAIRTLPAHGRLLIIADDPATTRDIPNYCRYMQHALVIAHVNTPPYRYLIEKSDTS